MAKNIDFPGGNYDASGMSPLSEMDPGNVLIKGNIWLEEVIDIVYEDDCIDALTDCLKQQIEEFEEIIVPVRFVDENGNEIDLPDGLVPENTEYQICILTTDDTNEDWIPAFTNMNEASFMEGTNMIPMFIGEAIAITLDIPECQGMVVNPFGMQSATLPKELLEDVLEAAVIDPVAMLAAGIEAYDRGDMEAALAMYNQAARLIVDAAVE